MHQQEKSVSSTRDKYAKIPVKAKINLLRKVLHEQVSIKEAAAQFNINYSTAKTLIRQYKFNLLPYDLSTSHFDLSEVQLSSRPTVRCGFRFLETDRESKSQGSHIDSPSISLKAQMDLKPEIEQEFTGREEKWAPSSLGCKIEIISSILFN